MITLSSHFDRVEEYIAASPPRGVHVALSHHDATPEQIRRAVDAGATSSTHLGNGTGETPPRHPNVLWTQLAEDRLTTTMIADGHHMPADTLKTMVRAKGIERSILVSDVVTLASIRPAPMTLLSAVRRNSMRTAGRASREQLSRGRRAAVERWSRACCDDGCVAWRCS
jgi:N-acetylglucosamine-6-phosphate deacetylase